MYFRRFHNNIQSTIAGYDIKNQVTCYGYTIAETVDNKILIDGILSDYTNLEEARLSIKSSQLQERITLQIKQQLYEELPYNLIASAINKYHDVRVTDTLIESYIELASSKIFTIDPVIKDIKIINKLDTILEDHYEFILNDDSKILVSEQILQHINNILGNNTDIIEYMRESKEKFFHVLELINEE